jgi:hypothetical protein
MNRLVEMTTTYIYTLMIRFTMRRELLNLYILVSIALFFHRLSLISFFGRDDALSFVLVLRRPRGAAAPAAAARTLLGPLSTAE